MGFLVQVLLTAIAVWVSTVIPGIDLGEASTPAKIGTLVLVAIVFGLINAIIKPVVKLLGCVFYLLTLGLFGLVVNGLLFWLAGYISEQIGLPFEVTGFWPAFWGAIIVALTGWVLNIIYEKVTDND